MSDKSTKAQKVMKKKAFEDDDSILSDLENSQSGIECETCSLSFSDPKTYQSHVQGKKHQKKLAEAKLMAKEASKKQHESDDDDEDDDDDEMYCEVCDKYFSGYISYVAHVKGSIHAKNVKKQKLRKQQMNMPELVDQEKDVNNSDDDDDILQKPYAKCATCQKAFSGPEPLKLHMKSTPHLKKVKQSQALQKLKDKHEKEATNSGDDEEFYSKCDVCQKSFSGLVPYHIHMQSSVHKKGVEKKKVAEEIKEFCDNDNIDDGYVCKECKKTFTDPLAFKAHLKNNSHEKQKAKKVLLEFLNAYPEIVYVVPLDKEDSGDESDSEGSDSTYYLICKLCHASFSGPESAQDHVKSKKHISIKKEKRMIQLLKEQKKNSSLKSETKTSGSNSAKSSAKEISANGNSKNSVKDCANNGDDFEIL